jgi:hypothetical protein
MPTPIDFPSNICQVSASIGLRTAGGSLESPWNFSRYHQDWAGERWEIAIDFLSVRHAQSGILDSFLLKIRQGSQSFRLGDPSRSLPIGSASGTPVVSGVATVGATTLATSGWTASTDGQLKAGDYLQIGDNYHMALADVDSDGSGNATIELCPRLRRAHANATPIIVNNARGLFSRDATLTTFERGIHRTVPASLTAVEAL